LLKYVSKFREAKITIAADVVKQYIKDAYEASLFSQIIKKYKAKGNQ
jgi:hypothetical protein